MESNQQTVIKLMRLLSLDQGIFQVEVLNSVFFFKQEFCFSLMKYKSPGEEAI